MTDKQVTSGRTSSGQFTKGVSGNPKGRPPMLAPELRQKLDQAAPEIIDRIIESAINGDMAAARLILDRVSPLRKATTPPVAIPELTECVSLTDKANAVMASVGRGECSPDVASSLIQSIAACARVAEIDELERRITELEIANG
jgi:hypothetical protein